MRASSLHGFPDCLIDWENVCWIWLIWRHNANVVDGSKENRRACLAGIKKKEKCGGRIYLFSASMCWRAPPRPNKKKWNLCFLLCPSPWLICLDITLSEACIFTYIAFSTFDHARCQINDHSEIWIPCILTGRIYMAWAHNCFLCHKQNIYTLTIDKTDLAISP